MIHKFMEVLYLTDDPGKAITEARKLYKAPIPGKYDFMTEQMAMINFAHLTKFYMAEKSAGMIQTRAIEQPFNVMMGDIPVGGRFDQIIEWNGRIWLRDWKTTSKNFEYFAPGLDPNDQGIRYQWAASCLQYGQDSNGYPKKLIEGVIFVCIQNMKSFKEPKLQAMPKQWGMARIKKWVDMQRFWHDTMARAKEQDEYPMNETACTFCDFRAVCTMPDEASMVQQLKYNYILRPWDFEKVDQVIKEDVL